MLNSYLSNRSQRVKIGDTTSDWSLISRGIPQGSVLGPLLFNIFINDLLYDSFNSTISSYADDTQLFATSVDPIILQHFINADLITANEWFTNNGMSVNASKCSSMFMGRDLDDYYNDLPFKLGDNTISCCNNMHLLGVSIDDNLNFNDHITNITRKVSNQLQVLKRHKKLIPVSAKAILYKASYYLNLTIALLSGTTVAREILISLKSSISDVCALSYAIQFCSPLFNKQRHSVMRLFHSGSRDFRISCFNIAIKLQRSLRAARTV